MSNPPPRAWPALLLGAAAGSLAAVAAALTSPGLYTDWGSFEAALVVIPLFAIAAGVLVILPLAVLRRLAWVGVPLGLLVSVVAGELVFHATLGTAFARRSAARHWTAVERRAAEAREADERDVCRRLLAEPPIPPPPAPPGAAAGRAAPAEVGGTGTGLIGFSRERCAELLAR